MDILVCITIAAITVAMLWERDDRDAHRPR